MAILLIMCALVAAAIGVLALTDATVGVGIIGLSCLLGILARIAQAKHHYDMRT